MLVDLRTFMGAVGIRSKHTLCQSSVCSVTHLSDTAVYNGNIM